nr:hypothetical protein [Tanacetum cinerariifolium]
MKSLSPQVVSAAKLPILNPNEFDLWKMRIEQYFLMTDYSLWEVILNGDSPALTRVIDGVLQPVAPTTVKQRLARKNELKACGTLLMALPDKHQLKFNTHNDAKTLMEAIEKRFRGNTETKKVQTTLLKQQYENFTCPSSESLDQIHDRLQKLISQLEILRVSLSQEDINLNDAASISAVSIKIPVSSLPNVDTLSNVVIYSFFASQSNSPQLDNDDLKHIDADDLEEMNLKWKGHFVRKCRSPKDTRRNGAVTTEVFKQKRSLPTMLLWPSHLQVILLTMSDETLPSSPIYDRYHSGNGYHVVPPLYTGTLMPPNPDLVFNNAPNAVETDHPAFTEPGQDLSHTHRPSAPIIEDWVSDSEDESETKTPQNIPCFVQTSIPKPKSQGKRKNRKACFVCKSLDHLIKDCDYHKKKMAQTTARTHAQRANHQQYARLNHPNPQRYVVPIAVVTQVNVIRPVTTVVPKINVTRPRQAKTIVTKPNLPPRRHINSSLSPKASTFPPKVTAAKAPMILKSSMVDMLPLVVTQRVLKFNLFSVSKMCDKKSSVLFTDTEYLVLSPDFKLPDENQVLLRVLKKNNMYIVNLKNIVPSENLTCLFAKATLDESNLWHRRLGHINFKTINKLVKGSGPTWLFDIDTLTRTMNYQPVTTCNQSNPSAGVQDQFDAEKADKEIVQQYVLFPEWSSGYTNPHNSDGDAAFDEKEPEFVEKKPESEVNVSPSSSAQSKKHDDKTKKEAKGKSPVESLTRYRNLSAEFEDISDNSINEDNVAGTLVPAVGQISSKSTNMFSADGHLNAAASPTHGKSLCIDTSQLPDDPDMPELEDITYSDDKDNVGAEADFNNLETSITVSSIPTARVHKDHHVTQIIGDLSSTTQTRSVTRVAKDQGGLSQINNKDFQTCMFSCFLSQEEPKREKGINYEEVFAPVARIKAIRLFLAYAFFMGFMVYQMDVKSAFLYGNIEEEVYVCQPLGFKDLDYPDKVYKVVKALYGLHQALRACQDKYVAEILRKFGLTDGKSGSTPIDTEKPLLKDPDGEDVDVHTYRSMIGSLMYLTASRPDIMFAVCAYARFQVKPKASHLHAVKMIFRYLKGKPHLGLWYSQDLLFDLVAYSNSDYAGQTTTGKEISNPFMAGSLPKTMLLTFIHAYVTVVSSKVSAVQSDELICSLSAVSLIKYALTVNPNIYVSCIKQFWATIAVKKVNDVTRLQALVDKKKVVVTEATIRDVFCLDDAEGVECLPNEEIFAELARMGYEKPSTKLTFYKAFFSSQWKKQVGDLSAHTTKYTSPALTQKVFANMRRVGKGFSGVETPLFKGMLVAHEIDECADEVPVGDVNAAKGAAEGDVSAANGEVPTADEEPFIPSPTPPTPPPQPSQDILLTSQVQLTPPQSPQAQPPSPQQQKQPLQDAKIPMNLLHTLLDTCTTLTRRFKHLEQDKIAQALEITKLKQKVKKLERRNKVKVLKLRRLKKFGTVQRIDTSDDIVMDDVSNQGRMIADMDADADVVLEEDKDVAVDIVKDVQDADVKEKIEPAEVQEVVDVVTTVKIITYVVTAASDTITAATTNITADEAQVPAAITTAAPTRLTAAPRRRKGVVIRDLEESTTSIVIPDETKSKDKGKRILVEEPKPLKKQAQIEQDEAFPREYQALKRKPQTEAQARKNMMIYLKNVAGFKMDYFKGMSCDDIRSVFEKHFDSNVVFLQKAKEQINKEESRALKRLNETQADKAAKRQKLHEEVEELKRHLQIVPNEEDDVYTEATPLALKVPVVDYEIYNEQNKPYYKIKRADDSHQLYLSFLVEKKYPLTKFSLNQMLNNVRLEVEEESEVSLKLLQFTRQQQQEGFIQNFGVDVAEDLEGKRAKCLMLPSQVKTDELRLLM